MKKTETKHMCYIPVRDGSQDSPTTMSLYIGKYPLGGEISANIIWGKKYEKANRKRGKMLKKKEEWGKKSKKGKEHEKRGS